MASALRCIDDQANARGVGFDYVAALLGDETTHRLIDRVGVAPDSDGWIDFVSAWKLLTANVALTADEGHQLAGAPVRPGNFELLMASMVQGDSLADGLARLASGAVIIRPDLMISLSHRHGALRLSLVLRETTLAAEIYAEALIVVIHCALRWALGRKLVPLQVRGCTAIGQMRSSLLDVLNVPVVRGGTGAALTYAADDVDAGFRVACFTRWHEASYAEYVRMVDELTESPVKPSSDALLRNVRTIVLGSRGDQTAVARRLGMSVPTLRRRLADRGTSFRQLCDELRRDAAEMLLLGDKSVEDIAEELGMSDARCFRRACNGWFGRSPSELRRTLRQDASPA